LEECALDKAIEAAAEKLVGLRGSFAGIISTRCPNETLSLFQKFVCEVMGSDWIDTLDGRDYRLIAEGIRHFHDNGRGLDIECPIEEILESDCIVVAGADPERTNPIISTLVRRAVSQSKAKLIVINSSRDVFPLWTDLWLKPNADSEGVFLNGLAKVLVDKGLVASGKASAELIQAPSQYEVDKVVKATGIEKERLELAAEVYGRAERGIIIYGEGLLQRNDPSLVTSLLNLADLSGNRVGDRLRVISLKRRVNSRGAWELGLAVRGIKQDKPKGLYLLLADEEEDGELLSWLEGIDFLVVQASYHSRATSIADVVLPSLIWAERGGKYVVMDGRVLESKRVLQPKEGLLQDQEILMELSKRLGDDLNLS